MNIALVQMQSKPGEFGANLKSTARYIKEAESHNAQIICFPELNLSGYADPSKYNLVLKNNQIKKAVRLTNKSTVLFGFAENSNDSKPYISQLIARGGKVLAIYRKQIIKDNEIKWYSAGGNNTTFMQGGKKFGIAICADIDEPKIFEKYKKMRVDFVFVCAAPDLYGKRKNRDWQKGFLWWQNNLKEKVGRYAKKYKLYIGVSTAAGSTRFADFPGGGYIFSPQGDLIAESKNYKEGVLYFNYS